MTIVIYERNTLITLPIQSFIISLECNLECNLHSRSIMPWDSHGSISSFSNGYQKNLSIAL